MPARSSRAELAGTLTDFEDQLDWYEGRAKSFKSRSRWIDMLIIVAGALIAALPSLRAVLGGGIDYLLVVLGVAIVVGQGMQRVYRYAETWPEYRHAAERMKRERRLFVHAAGPYTSAEADDGALYIERLESIMAEEQKIFFDARRADTGVAGGGAG